MLYTERFKQIKAKVNRAIRHLSKIDKMDTLAGKMDNLTTAITALTDANICFDAHIKEEPSILGMARFNALREEIAQINETILAKNEELGKVSLYL